MLKKVKKGLVIIPLSASLVLPISIPAANVSAEELPQSELDIIATSDAFNSELEQQKLAEMGIDSLDVKLEEGQPLTITFDDGSKIEYGISVSYTPGVTSGPVISEYETMATSYKTYSVYKRYFYLLAKATIYLYTDVKHETRSVTVRKAYPGFLGVFAKNDWQKTRVIDSYGENSDYATTEVAGQFTLGQGAVGDIYTKSYVLRMDIDPAGGAYLRVIQ